MTNYEKDILQEILNVEILSYLSSGYKVTDDYIVTLRGLIKKFDLKEVYNFDR